MATTITQSASYKAIFDCAICRSNILRISWSSMMIPYDIGMDRRMLELPSKFGFTQWVFTAPTPRAYSLVTLILWYFFACRYYTMKFDVQSPISIFKTKNNPSTISFKTKLIALMSLHFTLKPHCQWQESTHLNTTSLCELFT